MNTANQITLYRILLAFLFMLFMSTAGIFYSYMALIIFIIAAISDLFDGKIARKTGNVTTFGKIMDPLADKILVTAALVILVQEGVIPAWMVIIIISREFAVMGLRIVASKDNKIIEADKSGKYKTTAQLTAIIIILVFIVFKKTIRYMFNQSMRDILFEAGKMGEYVFQIITCLPYYLMLVTVVITIVSGINYFTQNKKLFLKEY